MNRNSSFIHAAALVAMPASALVLPLSFLTAAIVFAVAGVVAVLVADYGRPLEPVRAHAPVIPFGAPDEPVREDRRAA